MRYDGTDTTCKRGHPIQRGIRCRTCKNAKQWATADRNRAFIRGVKAQPCRDCGSSFHYVAMDFDHRPGESKVGDLAVMQMTRSIETLAAEIVKCDVVCSNCHRIREFARGYANQYEFGP